jgi:two-component system CheB/CheR fusion protein
LSNGETVRSFARPDPLRPAPARTTDIAELCRKLVLDCYAPAAILINAKMECIYSSGPASLYLRLAPGYPTHNVFSMMGPALRGKAKAAIASAMAENRRVVAPGGRVVRDGVTLAFNIDVQPVPGGVEKLLLLCFVDQPVPAVQEGPDPSAEPSQAAALERELELTRAELQNAVRSLEISTEEQNAINEEALSVNEEYQSTNEELLTSKEELQSLNEELTALNSQLQETLERSRTTSNDLQNVLYSTDVATLFLDTKFNIRFFTPAATQLFAIRQTDVGRPLSDFHARTADQTFMDDAKAVLENSTMVEREILSDAGAWFNRRTLPYRTHEGAVAGVVITFIDITERNRNRQALETARRESDRANIAKSRFLAAASHDLRQPLQTLALVSRLLGRVVMDEPGQKLINRLDETMNAMTGMLNALLDINQIDAGVIHADITSFPINHILRKLHAEFEFAARLQGTVLRKVPCSLIVVADARLLEQMIRNLLANALKYTKAGRVLLGCRRAGANLRIEIWDTGIGIAADQLQEIFEEYHQIDNAARERSRGLGLGLSIVRRLGELMALKVDVRSVAGKGSVFSIEVPLGVQPARQAPEPAPPLPASAGRTGKILVIEDDPDIRQLLELFLTDEGHEVAVAHSSNAALALVAGRAVQPDLILADYNLTGSESGLQAACRIRGLMGRAVPVIIVTGDISTATLRTIAAENCIQMNKPMKLGELTDAIQRVLAAKTPGA